MFLFSRSHPGKNDDPSRPGVEGMYMWHTLPGNDFQPDAFKFGARQELENVLNQIREQNRGLVGIARDLQDWEEFAAAYPPSDDSKAWVRDHRK